MAVVTDSTASLSPQSQADSGVRVIPLQVIIDGRSLAEGIEVSSADVAQALLDHRAVTTSRPSPAVIAEFYRGLDADRVVSVHLSGDLSGTVDAAQSAASMVADDGIEVQVVDSRCVGMALGFSAQTGAQVAAEGADLDDVARAVRRCAVDSSLWLYVDSLEYLRRGGRIGAAAAMLGSALAVKPLLHLVDGRIEPRDRVRTAARALARLEQLVAEEVGDAPVRIGVQHLAAPDRARDLADRLRSRLPGLTSVEISEVGAVIGAHVGPGTLGVAASPA